MWPCFSSRRVVKACLSSGSCAASPFFGERPKDLLLRVKNSSDAPERSHSVSSQPWETSSDIRTLEAEDGSPCDVPPPRETGFDTRTLSRVDGSNRRFLPRSPSKGELTVFRVTPFVLAFGEDKPVPGSEEAPEETSAPEIAASEALANSVRSMRNDVMASRLTTQADSPLNTIGRSKLWLVLKVEATSSM